MQRIRLPDDVDEREAEVWTTLRGERATFDHFDTLIRRPAQIEWPDGSIAAVYDRLDPEAVSDEARLALARVKPSSGIRSGGTPTRSRQVGGRPRYVLRQKEYGGRCTFERDYPELYEDVVELGTVLGHEYRMARPDLFVEQVRWVESEVRPEYRMVGPYTSAIINLDNALPYHRDGGNIPHSWNALVVLREDTVGGLLVVPAWRMAFKADDRWMLLMDAQRTTHGVTSVERVRVGGFRTSIVYYCLKGLAGLGSPDEERAHAARKRTEREERRAGLIP